MARVDKDSIRKLALETVAIAIGVFAALLADNWNEERKERLLANEFLDGIVLDLVSNAEHIARVESSAENQKKALERVIDGVRNGNESWTDANAFVEDLVRCTYLGIPSLSSVAFDELESTGSMRLIHDVGFKRKLAEYYSRFENQSQFHAEYRRKEAAVEEALLGFLPLSERMQMSIDESQVHSSIDIAQTLAELRQVPDLIARLEDMVWVQHRITTRYAFVTDSGDELLEMIDAMKQ